MSNFCPISLVSSLYKIIAKVLSIRLRDVMEVIVLNSQSAFVKSRQILDGILITNECVNGRKKAKVSGLTCKIDFKKAYDRVDWDFLLWVLKQKCFGDRWIKWIKGCLDHLHFSILKNGTSKGFFDSSRGIKQGDPLSPFLFTLVLDGLSELMEKGKSKENHRGVLYW